MRNRRLLRLLDPVAPVPGLGEQAVAIALIGLLVAAATSSVVDAGRNVMASEPLHLHSGTRVGLVEYRATYGGWPAARDDVAIASFADEMERNEEIGRYLHDVRYDGGGQVSFRTGGSYRGPPLTLSVRPATAPQSGATIWLCGHAMPSPGFFLEPDSQNGTSAAHVPSSCRGPGVRR